MRKDITLTINGTERKLEVNSNDSLVEVLRNQLGLTGTKVGCGVGDCGACTVIMDGKAVNACLVLTVEADGKDILTIEGLGSEQEVHPIQQAFLDEAAVQCGFCTPGMILSAKSLLDENPHPNESEIREALSGNLCRCTGYQKIIQSVKAVSQES